MGKGVWGWWETAGSSVCGELGDTIGSPGRGTGGRVVESSGWNAKIACGDAELCV